MQLHDNITKHFRTVESQKKALKRLGLETIQDLLFYFPTRYSDISNIKHIKDLEESEITTIYGKNTKPKIKKTFKKRQF